MPWLGHASWPRPRCGPRGSEHTRNRRLSKVRLWASIACGWAEAACELPEQDRGAGREAVERAKAAEAATLSAGTPRTNRGLGKRASPSQTAPESVPHEPRVEQRCPSDMLLIRGNYCDRAQQTCLRQRAAYEGHPTRSERCELYADPTRCLGTRTPLSVCIDRHEWPNRAGEKPLVLVSWQRARELCRSAGKRLCSEPEWTLACEGEAMLPYTTGHVRPVAACAIDRPYRSPRVPLLPHHRCDSDERCRRELARLDQRTRAQTNSACRSPFGVIDMNGNVNEWVNASDARYPHRGALKGGWWGPVRNRCRPAVHRHREDHWGYEIGFRCCRNVDGVDAGERDAER